jgi:hypothetical protein
MQIFNLRFEAALQCVTLLNVLSLRLCCSCFLFLLLLQINDLGFEAVRDPASGQLLFNVVVGGYFSIKRNIMSVPLGVAVTEDQLIPFTVALLRVFR